MTPRRQNVIVASSLHNVGDRSAVDLKIQSDVPSKVRGPQNDQTPTRMGGGSDRGCANKDKNQKESCDGGKSCLHRLTPRSGLARRERDVHRPVKFSEVVPTQKGLPGQPICHSAPGVRHTVDGRR